MFIKSIHALLVTAALLIGCARQDDAASQYLNDLGDLIARADRIEFVEHSSPVDFFDSTKGELISSKEISYGRLTLDAAQKKGFEAAIRALPPKTQDAFPACVFEAHHRIEFYSAGKLIDSMEICFHCGQVQWKGSQATPPSSLYGGLEEFFLFVGMHPRQDWRSLAAGRHK